MQPEQIASFRVDHDVIERGIYISRIDGDVTTYDLRTRVPNAGHYMSKRTMHSVEHMFATYIRSSPLGDRVLYFGPMGCATGFYLLVRGTDHDYVRSVVLDTLDQILSHSGAMFGATRKECGNYRCLSVAEAKAECRAYRAALLAQKTPFVYGGNPI